MGILADDMIEGCSCSHCGVYFKEEHGYPVLCESCHIDDKGETGLQQAIHPEV